MKKTIGIIGLGSISERHQRNIKFLHPDIQIICMPSSPFKTNRTANYCDEIVYDLSELLSYNPTFIIIASPATFHLFHAKCIIKARIPIFFEKPLAANIHDCEEIINLLNIYNIPAAVGYCMRYMPSAREVKRILANGVLGKVFHCQINVGQYLPNWRPSKNILQTVSASQFLGGGALLELSHEIDYAKWLFGTLKLCYSKVRSSEELNLDVEDVVDILAENDDGVIFNIHLDFLQKTKYRRCQIFGTQGSLTWDLARNRIIQYNSLGQKEIPGNPEWNSNNMYIDEIKDFMECIETKKTASYATVKEATEVIRFISDVKDFQ